MANIKQSQQAETYGSKNESRLNRLSTSSNDHENLAINKTGQSADTEPVVKIEAENNVRMKKSINLLHSVAILVAVTGHVSVFISPTAIFRNTDSVGMALIMWLIGGLLNLCMALIYTELGTIYPKAGGPYLYVLNVFGPLPAFLILWGYFIMITGPFWAFVAYTAALYTVQPIMGCKPSEEAVKVLAAWLIVTLVTLNCVYMKYVTKVQTLLSSTKLLGLILIITGGAVRLAQGETNNIQDAFTTTTKDPGKLSFAVFFSIFSYGAWQILSGLMEEVKDPGRDIPRAVYISFLIVVVKYILANLAYFIVLTPQEILETDAIAVDIACEESVFAGAKQPPTISINPYTPENVYHIGSIFSSPFISNNVMKQALVKSILHYFSWLQNILTFTINCMNFTGIILTCIRIGCGKE